jgi:hypothetical protein
MNTLILVLFAYKNVVLTAILNILKQFPVTSRLFFSFRIKILALIKELQMVSTPNSINGKIIR